MRRTTPCVSSIGNARVPLKVLQGRLGHATSKTMLDVYTHLAPSDTSVADNTIGSLLGAAGLNSGLNGSGKASNGKTRKKKKAR